MGKSELGQHVILRLEDDRVIAPTVADRRLLARVVLKVARPYRLLAFSCPDTHLHVEPACTRRAAGELVRRLEIGLAQRLDVKVSFSRARYRDIHDQRHLQRTFFYLMRQQEHHGCHVDPYHDGSNLPDLLGLRTLGAYTADNVRALLPRVRREDLLAALGVAGLAWGGPPPLELLADAAAAASGLAHLFGRSREVIEARRAAVHVAGRRSTAADLASALCCSESTIKRLRARPPDDALVRAVTRQLQLRSQKPPEHRLTAEVTERA